VGCLKAPPFWDRVRDLSRARLVEALDSADGPQLLQTLKELVGKEVVHSVSLRRRKQDE